jgi:hypothetical protein
MGRRLGLLVAAAAIAAGSVRPAYAGNESPAFERLKALVGEWEGKNQSGPVKITYTLVSGGSALMERLQPANEPEMITMYSADGDRILVTHYCSQGNQPQMQTAAMKAKAAKYSFALVRVSGMKSPEEGHMVGLVLTLVDRDHLTQEWKYLDKGKTAAEVFEYRRKPEKAATVVPSGS